MQAANYFFQNDVMQKYIVTFERPGHKPDQLEQYCTGTIIDNQWILTAGHCNVLPGHVVRLHAHGGPVSWSSETQGATTLFPGLSYLRCAALRPNDCFVNGRRLDLALVRLNAPVPLGYQFRKARITITAPFKGMKGWAAGGGDHDGILNLQGRLKWSDAVIVNHWPNNTLQPSIWPNNGDSGGPFMRWFNGNSASGDMELVGVWSSFYTQPYMTYVGYPDVREWIMKTIGKQI